MANKEEEKPVPLLNKENCIINDEESSNGNYDIARPSTESSTTKVVVLSTLIAACGSYVFGNAVGYSSPAESGIEEDLGLTVEEYSVFGSILTIGAMLGAVSSGKVANIIGRRGAMCFSEIFCIVGWVSIGFAKVAWLLDLGRFLVGCGIGLLSYVVPVYIGEITPKDVRGAFISLSQLMLVCGQAFAFSIGSLVNWRTLALVGIIPSLIQFLGLFFIPESPRWLAKKGGQFESSLQRLRGENANICLEATDIRNYTEKLLRNSEGGIVDLFQWIYAYPVTVGVGLMVFQQFGGVSGFAFYASEIFSKSGFPSNVGIIAASVVKILSATLGVILIDKSGRRPVILISAAGMCLGCVVTGIAFLLQDLDHHTKLVPGLVLIGVLVFLGFFDLGMGGIPWIIMSEIFPINMKGSAGSLVSCVNWLGSWVISFSFNYLFEWSSTGTFFIFGGVCGGAVLFIWKVVPETKGRALEEIQASITQVIW